MVRIPGDTSKRSNPVAEMLQFLMVDWAFCREHDRETKTMRMAQARLKTRLGAGLCLLTVATAFAAPEVPSGWHLLRSKNPTGGADAVSMNRAADITSDLDLAGLMLRCHDGRAEVLVVVVTPFAPRSQPAVTISANGQEWHFDATVVPPGAQLLLPATATALATGFWQSANQLAVKISWQQTAIAGVIPIDGLRGAVATLIANCPAG
jgi:hypothetical protein